MGVLICDRKGPHRSEGHFKDYEVGSNCIVLLIECLWEGGVFLPILCPKFAFLRGHFGKRYKPGWSRCTHSKSSVRHERLNNPPFPKGPLDIVVLPINPLPPRPQTRIVGKKFLIPLLFNPNLGPLP